MKNRIPPVWIEGTASRQAHCDLPEGTFEREIGRAGFLSDHAMIAATKRHAATVIDAKTIPMDIKQLRVRLPVS